jgi:hypothetical protein
LGRTTLTVVLIGVLAGPQAGCSFLFVKRPPPVESRHGRVHCTSSTIAPVLDTLGAGGMFVHTALTVSAPDTQYVRALPISRNADIALGISLTALYVASTIAGFAWTSECGEARAGPQRNDKE